MDAVTFQAEAMKVQCLLWRVSWSILGNNDDCADAVQEALTRAWQHKETLRNLKSFRPWLTRILTNVCNDMLRQRMRGKVISLEDASEPAHEEELADPLSVREAIDGLSPEQRTVMVLYYLEGATISEIADMLDLSPGTVKSRMTYARRRLRAFLDDEGRE